MIRFQTYHDVVLISVKDIARQQNKNYLIHLLFLLKHLSTNLRHKMAVIARTTPRRDFLEIMEETYLFDNRIQTLSELAVIAQSAFPDQRMCFRQILWIALA